MLRKLSRNANDKMTAMLINFAELLELGIHETRTFTSDDRFRPDFFRVNRLPPNRLSLVQQFWDTELKLIADVFLVKNSSLEENEKKLTSSSTNGLTSRK